MSFAPTDPAGVVTVTLVALVTENVADAPPMVTPVVVARFAPVSVIDVPPTVGPAPGLTDAIVGAATYVNPFARVAVPPSVVTETVFAPALPVGVTAVMLVALVTENDVAATPPIATALAPVRLPPVIVIVVPPVVGPALGLTDVIVGAGTYVKPFARLPVPPGVVTDTGFGPARPVGVTAVMLVALVTENDVAATPPIVTPLANVKLVPVIVIVVPPDVGPWFGVTDEMAGAAR
jgi:hypothetical protein